MSDQPFIAVSNTTTLDNPTGSWKYIRPRYRDMLPPCNCACPVGIDVEGYMNLVREGRIDEAIDLLLLENPMPAVTGRVCHHPCETECNRYYLDEPVSVHAVERILGELALERDLVEPPGPIHSERIAVVGGGPAGLGCAYHLARAGYSVVVLDEAEEPGGILRQGIPQYRLPSPVLDMTLAHIAAAGVKFRCGIRVGRDLDWNDLTRFDAVFVATGAHRQRRLGIRGESGPGVMSGLAFLKRINRSSRPPMGRRVVVVGGGNTAMDCARTALRLGADVTVLYRRTRSEMPAIAQEIVEAEREGVGFLFLAAPTRFYHRDGRLVGVRCTRMELGPRGADGRRRPEPVKDGAFTLVADTVLTATGEQIDDDCLPPELDVTDGALPVGALGEAGTGIFAGGDLAGEERTVAHALGSGKRAAVGIDRWLRRRRGEPVDDSADGLRFGTGNISAARWRGVDPVRRTDPADEVAGPDHLNLAHFPMEPRTEEHHLGSRATDGFQEVNIGMSPARAFAEARRCFNCGVCNSCELCLLLCPDVAISRRGDGGFIIDLEHCKGCGLCAQECPRGAITMTREGL